MSRILLAIAIALPIAAGLYVLLQGGDGSTPSTTDRDAYSAIQVVDEVDEKAAIEITAENFEELVASSEVPVVIDFWASWCAPCMMLSPHIDEIAKEYGGKAVVGKVNVDQQPELAKRFKADAIPLVLIFEGGEVVERMPEFKPETPGLIRATIDRISE